MAEKKKMSFEEWRSEKKPQEHGESEEYKELKRLNEAKGWGKTDGQLFRESLDEGYGKYIDRESTMAKKTKKGKSKKTGFEQWKEKTGATGSLDELVNQYRGSAEFKKKKEMREARGKGKTAKEKLSDYPATAREKAAAKEQEKLYKKSEKFRKK